MQFRIGKYLLECQDNIWEYGIISEILFDDVYMIRNIIKANINTVVDIGANIGVFSILCAHLWPNAKIKSYEPCYGNYNILIKNIENIVNICGYKVAVIASDKKEAYLTREGCEENLGGSRVSDKGSEKISCTHIKNIITNEDIDLLKIDCEGGEGEILPYLNSINYFNKIKIMVGEYHTPFEYVVDLLNKTHYVIKVPNPYLDKDFGSGTFQAILKDLLCH